MWMELFLEVALVLAIATGMAFLMQRLKQPLVLGHVLTGILVGPIFFNLLNVHEGAYDIFAKLGITSLLFIVGLSLSPKVVREVGGVSVAAGLGQVVFTSFFGFALGLVLGFPLVEAFFIALALTFSSTIIILKSLQDSGDLGTLHGKISVGILLVQDVVATGSLILISTLGNGASSGQAITVALLKALLLSLVIAGVSKLVLPALTRSFANSQEFLLLFSVSWGLALAGLFHLAGFSIEIGALAAGISLASSPYHFEISAKMKLLRDFFIVLFFIVLGAGLTFENVERLWIPTAVFSIFVIIGNPLIMLSIMGAMGYNRRTAFLTGLSMAQVSEFSLVLILLAAQQGHVTTGAVALVTLVALVTIGCSSYLLTQGNALYEWFKPFLGFFERTAPKHDHRKPQRVDAMLFGCHRLGQDFLPILKDQYRKYLVVDFDPAVIDELKRQKIPCRYGDVEDNEFLDELDLEQVKLVICTLPDVETHLFLLNKIRRQNTEAIVVAMAHTADEAVLLYKGGADYVILPHYLGGNYAALMIEKYGLDAGRFAQERRKHLTHLQSRLKPRGHSLPVGSDGA